MTALLCAVVLVAQTTGIKPLPEERKLVGVEQIALDYGRVEVPKLGTLSWTKTTVRRGELEGSTHYSVHRIAELADFEAPGFMTMEFRGLYNSDLQLVREIRSKARPGAKPETVELEWDGENFRWRKGRAAWVKGGSEMRPTADADIALFVHGLSIPTPWQVQVFDEDTEEIETRTLQPGKKKVIDDESVTIFEVQGSPLRRHFLREDGTYVKVESDTFTLTSARQGEDTELTLRREVADNESFGKIIEQALSAAWSEKKGTYTNPTLGLSLKLPKGWVRATADETDGTVFQAYSADQNAFMYIGVTVLGTGYAVDEWSDNIREGYIEIAEDGKVKTKKKALGKVDATSFSYVLKSEAPFDTEALVCERNGLGLIMSGGTWQEAPKKLDRETKSILKSIKFAR